MATGTGQSGGVFAWPDVPQLGYDTWEQMSSMSPASPHVGGSGWQVESSQRQVALGAPNPMSGHDAPMKAHYSEVLNLKGNPIGWILIASILYLGLAHVSLHGSIGGGVGAGRRK